jgi:hypothetical protein
MHVDHRFGGLSNVSAVLLVATIAVGLIHHTDHVLRVDHSGWPFRPDVNPFTFSLFAYPILLFALLGPARLFWLRWFILLVGTGFTIWAHTMIETPAMQYAMWAQNHSLEPQHASDHNLLGLQSSLMGMVAVAVAMTLNLLLVLATLSMLRDGLGRRAVTRPVRNY